MLVIHTLVPASLFRFTRMVIFEIGPQQATDPVPLDASIRWAGLEDVTGLTALGHPRKVLEQRFSAGARACILTENKRVLAYVWFHGPRHDEEDLAVRFTLGTGEIWLFDAMVRADQRGRGLYPRLLRRATRDLAVEGVRRILIAIDAANRNSLRAHRAADAEPIGTVASLRILGFTFVRDSRGIRAAWTGRTGYVCVPTSQIAPPD